VKMGKKDCVEEKEKRERESLTEHERLARLFREDRFAFERERKRMIDDVINSARGELERERLRTLQASWDRKMKGAGSRHNRFVMAQSLFWDHFYGVWQPAMERFRPPK